MEEAKKAAKENYVYQTSVGAQGSVMAYRDNYLDLDPTYKDANGLPLLRMTFDWRQNELKLQRYLRDSMVVTQHAFMGDITSDSKGTDNMPMAGKPPLDNPTRKAPTLASQK